MNYVTADNLKSALVSLKRNSNTLISEKALEAVKNKSVENIITILYKMYKALMDYEDYLSRNISYSSNEILYDIDSIRNNMTNYVRIYGIIDNIVRSFRPEDTDISYYYLKDSFRDYHYTHLASVQNKLASDIALKILSHIDISSTNRTSINYINPCAYELPIIQDNIIKRYASIINMYAITSDTIYDSSSYKNIISSIYEKRLIEYNNKFNNPSTTSTLKITNNAFDIMNIQPKITLYLLKKANALYNCQSLEFYALNNNFRLLRPSGILIYTIPFSRLSNEIILFLSKNLKDISIIKHDNNNEHLISILGYKESSTNYSEQYKLLKETTYDQIPNNIDYEYIIPSKELNIDLFRGGIVNPKDVEKLISRNGLYESFYEQAKNNKVLKDDRPLLPFNIGQIGLILTSGKLDGVIEESDDNKHIIKGRTIKYEEELTPDGDSVRKVKKSNKVQINAFDAEGNFIVIS